MLNTYASMANRPTIRSAGKISYHNAADHDDNRQDDESESLNIGHSRSPPRMWTAERCRTIEVNIHIVTPKTIVQSPGVVAPE